MMQILKNHREHTDEAADLMDRAYKRFVELSNLPSRRNFSFNICFDAVELATLFSRQGDREKTWKLFQIAVAYDIDNHRFAIRTAKAAPGQFAVVQDMPEFQKLLADTPQTEVEKYQAEVNRKREVYAGEAYDAFKSFVAVEADGELFTGIILTRLGHILVPAAATKAKVIRAKIIDYHPVKIVAVDAESDLAIIKVDGQKYLRPVVHGNVEDLQEFALISLPNPGNGGTYHIYPDISTISVHGHPNKSNLQAEIQPDDLISRQISVMQLDTDGRGKVASLKVISPGQPGEFIKGAAAVYYDERLLAVSPDDEVKYDNWGASVDPIPINQIRAALERMGMTQEMNRDFKKPEERFEMVLEAENFTRLKGQKPKVQPLLIAKAQPFLITKDLATSGGAYIVANPALEDQHQVGESWLTYEIEIPEDGDYAIWLYARGYTGKSDSFFVGTDLESLRACDVTSYRQWGTVPAVDRNSVQGIPAFSFTKGNHEIRLAVRETGTELDALLITNDLSLGSSEIDQRFASKNNHLIEYKTFQP